ADPVAPIGERAGERAQKHHWKEFGHRDYTEPGSGMDQRPCQPSDGDALHPYADQRDGVPAGVDAIVPVGKRLDDIAEPPWEQAIANEGQEVMEPCVGSDMPCDRTARDNSAAIPWNGVPSCARKPLLA